MRPEQIEVLPRGVRGRSRAAIRREAERKASRRRVALESLEPRALMAVLPSPQVASTTIDITNPGNGKNGAEYDPQIAVDPSNPLNAVMVYSGVIAPPIVTPNPVSYVAGAATTDGGLTWRSFNLPGAILNPTTQNPTIPYASRFDASVAFDRNGNFYVLEEQSSNASAASIPTAAPGSSGALVLHKYSFASGNPTLTTNTTVYQWVTDDIASSPTLAVDSSLASFSDTTDDGQQVVQADSTTGNVYVGWISTDTPQAGNPLGNNFNPNRVLVVASTDGGQTFSGYVPMNDPGNNGVQRNARIRMTVSQGSNELPGTLNARVPGGQLSVVWEDMGSLATASPVPLTIVNADHITGNPVAQVFSDTTGGPITDATDPGGGAPHIPGVTDFPINVSITDPRFTTLSDLNVTINITHPNIDQLQLQLVPPPGSGLQPITLVRNQTNAAGVTNAGIGVSGANFGTTAPGFRVGTVFDDQAARSIVDINPFTGARGAGAAFVGHFRPEVGTLSSYNGSDAATLTGAWTLRITDFRSNGTNPPPAFVANWKLEFVSGFQDNTDVAVATPQRNIASPAGAPGIIINAAPVIASDNTLGAFSQFQGRLYIAYVDRTNANGNPADNSDIYLSSSDDGGFSWSFPTLVNDDNSGVDGYTESDPTGSLGQVTGRAQYQPQLAVDQSTGTVVLSWLDTRDDASRSRTAYYLTDSIDGGETFSPDVYANPSKTATDAITGQIVKLQPQLDNLTSTASGATNVTLGTGIHQGLAVSQGHVYPIWSSNLNAVRSDDPNVDIRINPTLIPVGPRIVANTMGPVGEPDDTLNNTRTSDGSPQASAFVVVFDRPLDPSTFTTSDVQVFFRDTTANNTTGGLVPVISVTPLDLGFFGPALAHGATTFRVNFAPRSAVGTYSYVVGPNINDRVRSLQTLLTPIQTQSFTAVAPQVPRNFNDFNGFPTTVTSVIPVAGIPAGQVITDVNVNLTISYPFTGDLRLTLIAPDGTRVLLVNQRPTPFGGSGTGFQNTTFDDQATGSITNGSFGPPYTGSFQPEQPLAGLINRNPNGNWTLQITDLFTNGFESGTLSAWSLQIQSGTVAFSSNTGNKVDQDGDAVAGEDPGDAFAAPKPLNGVTKSGSTYVLTAPFDQDTLPLIVPGPHVATTHAAGGTATATYSATGTQVNVAIPNPGTLNSTVAVTGQNGKVVSGVKVSLSINHVRDADLRLILIAPDGTQVLLANQRGGVGANYTNTTFDDQAATSISTASAPFTGSFRPEVPLANLIGKVAQGTWTLRVTDLNGNAAGGTLVGFSLTLTTDNATTVDNLVLDSTVSSLDVTFDRDMDPSTFTPDDVLRIMGPSGPIIRPYIYTSTVSQPIPDAPSGPLVSTLLVVDDGSFLIGDLNVSVQITHPHDADLKLVLIAPDGTRITLVQNAGGATGANFSGTTFDDEGLTSINSATAPFTGVFRPAQALSALDGKQLKGIWKLEVTDSTTGNVGTLNGWALSATPAVTVTPNPLGTDPDPTFPRTYRVSFPTQQLSGTYTVDLGPNILSKNGDAIDKNLNAGVDLLKGNPSGLTAPVTYNATSVPVAIPDLRTVSSSLTVTDNFVIQDVSVVLNITHPNDPDLQAVLVAPDGSRITLFSNLPATGNRQNFSNTLLNDNAPTPIASGGSPYFSTNGFRPQQSLLTALKGKLSAGTYTLEITDTAAGNTGTLNSWSLVLVKPLPATGLGETVADRTTATFRIFTNDPTNVLSSSTWTAVGPAALGSSSGFRDSPGSSGRIGGLAVDPSDPSGNTVYVGGASGGIWKTTNFLDPLGPTYIPLTDFGPTFGINIGGIAVFARNNDPNQSIIFAATGEGDTGSTGVGFLRSMDGGATWTLLDSTDNTLPFANRNHAFATNGGITSYKIVADPNPTTTGDAIVYAALSGNNGGIWRSIDSGMHWTNQLAGQATDVTLDLASRTGVTSGNIQNVFAGMRGVGVFSSTNQGQTWNLMTGGVGDPLIIDTNRPAVTPVGVTAPLGVPTGAKGRIVLAKPAPTGILAQDIVYQGWLYAAVATPDSHLDGLYMTKDFGQNWVRLRIATLPPNNGTVRAIATNDDSAGNPNYDIGGGPAGSGLPAQGNYDLSLAVDPTNPNVVYLGGTADGQPTGFIRVDAALVNDAHSLVAYDNTKPGGATLLVNSNGPLAVDDNTKAAPTPFLNLLPNTTNPFTIGSTAFVPNSNHFNNTGVGVKWIPFDLAGTDQHRIVTTVDPLTGHARIIIGDDQGVYTAVDDNGTFSGGIGTAPFAGVNRNGNLQITQFYYGAAQPSNIAAQISLVQGMIYGSAQDNGGPSSDPNVLDNGNIAWSDRGGDATGVATDQQGSGTLYQFWWPCCGGQFTNFFQVNGVGRTNGLLLQSNPGPTPDPEWPTTFGSNFAVNPLRGDEQNGQVIMSSATGRVFRTENAGRFWSVIADPTPPNGTPALDGTYAQALAFGAPDPTSPSGVGNLDNFLYAGTVGGHIYVTQTGGGTPGQGNAWININNGALAGNTAPFQAIVTDPLRGSHRAYAVTTAGVYYTPDSISGTWQNITSNLFGLTHTTFGDPTFVQTIAAYLTSMVADWRYTIPDDPAVANGPTHPMLYVGGEAGVFRSADNGKTWTPFPDTANNATPTPPGDGGGLPLAHVTDLDASLGLIDPSTGRALARTTDTQGRVHVSPNILLATTFGRGSYTIRLAPQVFTDPSLLHLDASLPAPGGSDSGIFAADRVTNVLTPVIDGLSQQTAFGSTITINLLDLTPLTPGGPLRDPTTAPVIGTATTDSDGRFRIQVMAGYWQALVSDGVKTLGIQATDEAGTKGNVAQLTFTLDTTPPATPDAPVLSATLPAPNGSDNGVSKTDRITSITNPSFTISGLDPTGIVNLYRDNVIVATLTRTIPGATTITLTDPGPVSDGTHLYKVQAIDLAGNASLFSATTSVTVDTVAPARPAAPTLDPLDDSGTKGDNITNVNRPRFDGTAEPNGIALLIDAANNVIGQVNVTAQGTYSVTGLNPLQPTIPLTDGTYTFRVISEDVAGNLSLPSLPVTVTIRTQVPNVPTLALVSADDSGVPGDNITNVTRPRFTGTATPNLNVQLIAVSGNIPDGKTANPPTTFLAPGSVITPLVPPAGNDAPIVVASNGTYLVQLPRNLPEGTYTIKTRVLDAAGNATDSAPLTFRILTTAQTIRATLALNTLDDTGTKGDNATVLRRPRFVGVATNLDGTPAAGITIDVVNMATGASLSTSPQTVTTDSRGQFSFTLASDLNNGSITLQVRPRDIAGNQGDPAATLPVRIITAAGDYDDDGKADLAVYRPSADQFLIMQSTAGPRGVSPFGVAGATPLQGDFDGDGKVDPAEYNKATATWYIQRTTRGPQVMPFGQAGVDLAVPADYDGDGVTDLAVYRPTTGQWFILQSAAGPKVATITGLASQAGDVPIPADYDGDGKADLAVYRPSTGVWTVQQSKTGTNLQTTFGASTDVPIPADYDGDGKADLALFRPSTAQWFIIKSKDGPFGTTFGAVNTDVPVPLDYDGDGKADLAVYRPSTGQWLINQSTAGPKGVFFGGGNLDIAVPTPQSYNLIRSSSVRSAAARGSADNVAPAAGQGASLNLGATAAGFSALSANSLSNGSSSSFAPSASRRVGLSAAGRGRIIQVRHDDAAEASQDLRNVHGTVLDEALAHLGKAHRRRGV